MSDSVAVKNIIEYAEKITGAVSKIVLGQEQTARLISGAFLIGGHVLIEGPPGIAKTLLARTFSQVIGCTFRRVQFTPDLMPSDLTGVSTYDRNANIFKFFAGPIFTDILLADEVNRTPPKTQAALLEAMEERKVTIDGESKDLGEFFFVIATQNPIEYEGTFPLPEAQLDRFLFRLRMSYPSKENEAEMIQTFSTVSAGYNEQLKARVESVISTDQTREVRRYLRSITLSPAVADYIVRLSVALRDSSNFELGPSPRAGLGLALAAKFEAALNGREYVVPDDVKKMLEPVMNHRVIFSPELYDRERDLFEIVREISETVPVPDQVLS